MSSNQTALNIIEFATHHLSNWQQSLEMNNYKSLKELCDDIYGPETWKAISLFGGIDTLIKVYYEEKGIASDFTNHIIEYFKDYPNGR